MQIEDILFSLEARKISPEEAERQLRKVASLARTESEDGSGESQIAGTEEGNQSLYSGPPNISPIDKPRGIALPPLTAAVGTTKAVPDRRRVLVSTSADTPKHDPTIDRLSANNSFATDVLQTELVASLAEMLQIDSSLITADKPFTDFGLDSVLGLEWIRALNLRYGLSLPVSKLYEYPTVQKFADVVAQSLRAQENSIIEGRDGNSVAPPGYSSDLLLDRSPADSARSAPARPSSPISAHVPVSLQSRYAGMDEPIAIIGIAGRYADAENVAEYWANLAAGRNAVREIPSSRWDISQYSDQDSLQSGTIYSKWLGMLSGVDEFDPLFFHIAPTEAEAMDPQQRLFLQEAYRAFEDAGYSASSLFNRKCGVYLGILPGDYALGIDDVSGGIAGATGWSSAIAAARISYFLDLKGPAIAIDTACSASLVATHLACQALRTGEIDMALAGGVTLYLSPSSYVAMCSAGMLSRSGECKTFDNSADGFVPGEGVGTFVLKRLGDAEAAGDHIHGVIIGSGINQDGKTNGITAPNLASQVELMRSIYATYRIHPETISYVEAHGTGTKLGDPIELEALATVFRERTRNKNYCAIGSVKSNIGHTAAAAGVASVHKVLLALKHRQLPPTLHFETPNEHFNFADSPFYVNVKLKAWEVADDAPRRAAISSFGYSGTNAHLVVEEYRASSRAPIAPPTPLNRLFLLSAKSDGQLQIIAGALKQHVETNSTLSLDNIAYTLQVGREPMSHRVAFLADSRDMLFQALDAITQCRPLARGVRGEVKKGKDNILPWEDDEDAQSLLRSWIKKNKLMKIAQAWTHGLDVEWQRFYPDPKPHRVSLPTYPFAKERYWLDMRSHRGAASRPGNRTDIQSHASSRREAISAKEAALSFAPDLPSLWRALPAPAELTFDASHESLEASLAGILFCQLRSIGLFAEEQSTLAQLIAKLPPSSFYGRWLEQSIQFLVARDYLSLEAGPGIKVRSVDIDSTDVWAEWDRNKTGWLKDPMFGAQLALVDITLRTLPDILTGKRRATDIIFPDSSMHLVEKIYKGNPISAYFNNVLADIVAAYAKECIRQDPSSRIRILEIGAGTGATSAMVFEKLAPYQGSIEEYCYTDVSKAFLLHAENEYRESNPYLTCSLFNVEAPFSEQSIPANSFDVVIAANVLHATKNIRVALRNAKAALKRNGLLLLNELAANSLVIHAGLALLEGWWLHEDTSLRIPGCPGLYPETWRSVLEEEGFRFVFFPAEHAHALGLQIIVAESDGSSRINDADLRHEPEGLAPGRMIAAPATHTLKSEEQLREQLETYLKELVGHTLKIPPRRIDSAEMLDKYGIDSILVGKLTASLKSVFGNVSSTLFFEHRTIDALARHFLLTERETLHKVFGAANRSSSIEVLVRTKNESASSSAESSKILPVESRMPLPRRHKNDADIEYRRCETEDIAIIGLSGRFPGAGNMDEFWSNLTERKDCITEIPKSRWPLDDFYQSDPERAVAQGKSYCKWGGFLNEIDNFDSRFFSMPAGEAEMLTLQDRLFLETVWNLLESSGHTRESLQRLYRGSVGVYLGALSGGPLTSFNSSTANIVSHFFNMRGPSLAIDTMSSSAMTAIHLACEGLRRGDCELAIAGAVNILSPDKYIAYSRLRTLATRESSRSFANGDGFLLGECVGAVLLKPLSIAIDAGDRISAIIKSSSMNHRGGFGGYGLPNPGAQSQLIEECLARASIDPRTITYVEAAANGSALGDSIEIHALAKVFQKLAPSGWFCRIGSVKSNMGHAEAASGITQLAKVVLQLQHKQVCPLVHVEPLNPSLSLDGTPLHLQYELEEWERPIIENNGEMREYPRRALINSYGGGGSYVSLIVEEYVSVEAQRSDDPPQQVDGNPQLIVVSAKNARNLRALCRRLHDFIRRSEQLLLSDIAYTLQVGREAMDVRAAMVVANRDELLGALANCAQSEFDASSVHVYRGHKKYYIQKLRSFLSEEMERNLIQTYLTERALDKLAAYWTNGGEVPWHLLHGRGVRKVVLPTYPFDGHRTVSDALNLPVGN